MSRTDRLIRLAQVALAVLGAVLIMVAVVMDRSSQQRADNQPGNAPATTSSSTPPPPATSKTPSSTASVTSTSSAPPTHGHDDDTSAEEVRQLRAATRGAPASAERVMRLLSQAPEIGYSRWWAKTRGLLSDQGRTEMVGIDPQRVPFRKVTGQAQLVLPSELDTADEHGLEEISVLVPTDVGRWTVLLSRESEEGAWRVSSLRAPEGVH
ncbi:hypothetical protein [Janibacter sp. LM]|uniref:hypothetical protein n=1 Tax=Janibacter sp. LM TaxID=3144845 RepID=UPI0031F641FE